MMTAYNFKKIAGAVILLVLILMLILYIYREKEISRYMEKLELVEQDIDTRSEEISNILSRLEVKQDELSGEFEDISVVISDQMKSKRIGEDFFSFLDKPESRGIYREQQGILVDEIFRDLYDELELNDAEVEELRGLLVDREMINLEILVSLIKGNMTDTQKFQNEEKFNEMLERAEKNIRDFFQIDEYEIYENYLTSLEYRNIIREYRMYLAESDMDLDLEQEERLFENIRDETNNFNFTEELNLVELRRQGELSSENRARLARYLDEQAELDRLIQDNAREFLTEVQLQKLGDFQLMKRNMTEMGFEVASGMDLQKQEAE